MPVDNDHLRGWSACDDWRHSRIRHEHERDLDLRPPSQPVREANCLWSGMKKARQMPCIRLSFTLVLAALLVSGADTANAGLLKTFDLFPSFFRCFDVFPTDKRTRLKLFVEGVIQPNPEIYRRSDVFRTDPATLEKYLDEVTSYLPAIRKIHARFISESDPVEASFSAHFPDFEMSKANVYLMASLFLFDGKIPHENPRALFLALDGLAKFHGANVRLDVILSHELFHLYHFQVNPLPAEIDRIPLYRQIWQEGLATYASGYLNPGASLADVLLDPQLARDGPKYVPVVARTLLTQLEAADDETTARYLSYRRGSETPSRMGYLVGYDIVAHLALTRSLQELSRIRGRRLLHLIQDEMRQLANLESTSPPLARISHAP